MIDVILDKCLEDMRAHRASVAECLAKYPHVADELAPLLEIAQAIESVSDVRPSETFKQRTRQQILSLARPSIAPKFGVPFPRLSFTTAAFVVIVIFALTAGMVYASGDSLPGSPLYPIKRSAEQVQLWFVTDPEGQTRVHLALADRRLAETAALAQSGQSILAEQSLNEYTDHLNAALAALQAQPAEQESPLARELVDRVHRQQNELRALPPSSPGIQDALSASQKALEKLTAVPPTPAGPPAAQPTPPAATPASPSITLPMTATVSPFLPTPAVPVPIVTRFSQPITVPLPGPMQFPSPKPYP